MQNLVQFALLKSLAERTGVESIDRRAGLANIKFHQQSKVDPFRLMALVRNTPNANFSPAGVLKLPLTATRPNDLIAEVRTSLLALSTEELVTATKK